MVHKLWPLITPDLVHFFYTSDEKNRGALLTFKYIKTSNKEIRFWRPFLSTTKKLINFSVLERLKMQLKSLKNTDRQMMRLTSSTRELYQVVQHKNKRTETTTCWMHLQNYPENMAAINSNNEMIYRWVNFIPPGKHFDQTSKLHGVMQTDEADEYAKQTPC